MTTMTKLTVEEIALLTELDCNSRTNAIKAALAWHSIAGDEDLKRMYRRLAGKLYGMSDKEFETLNPEAWAEDFAKEDAYVG